MQDFSNDIDLTLISERHQTILEIEKQCHQLNSLFLDLNTLLSDQGVLFDNIEHNLQKTVQHTEEGLKELGKAEKIDLQTRVCVLM